MLKVSHKLLVSRFLTRMGDQAWDFAVPVSIAFLFPNQLSLVAALFLVTKAGLFLLQPRVAALIDHWSRWRTAVVGIAAQLLSVICVALFLLLLVRQPELMSEGSELSGLSFALLVAISVGSITASLGSGLMDIAVGQDWLPLVIEKRHLSVVNSQMKRVDLLTEVVAPVLAGVVLSMQFDSVPLAGLMCVALWNVLSFVPELILLRSVFLSSRELKAMNVVVAEERTESFLSGLTSGWRQFFSHPIAFSMVAYSCLWLSVLSPHGVLLTSFLKGSWHLSEPVLGIFRGAGAIFGLSATFLFPRIRSRLGVAKTSSLFIQFQAVTVLMALVCFFTEFLSGFAFLLMILFSRIGLYGFSIGEGEIRQQNIALGSKGKVNGVASSLNSLATLFLFAIGAALPSQEQFYVLVIVSGGSVLVGAVLFHVWMKRTAPGSATIQQELKI